jgi:hypothetical protein
MRYESCCAVLPAEEPPEQVRYTPAVVAYVASVCVAAVVIAALSRPTLTGRSSHPNLARLMPREQNGLGGKTTAAAI